MTLRRIVIGLSAAFAEEDDLDGFEEDAKFNERGHIEIYMPYNSPTARKAPS
jgi:hypothetical protein